MPSSSPVAPLVRADTKSWLALGASMAMAFCPLSTQPLADFVALVDTIFPGNGSRVRNGQRHR